MQFMLENPAWFVGLLSDQSGRLNQMVVPGEGERVWIFFGVLFALGAAMICWALMRRLRNSFLFGISLSLILLSQILIPSADKVKEWVFPLMRVLVIPGRSGILQVFYPLIPWLGIAGLGIILGRVISQNEKTAYRRVFWGGALFVSLFLFFRFMGGFGNFHTHVNITWMNVLNLTKYPPSLTLILLTLGICLFLMWLFSKSGKTFHNGKNPLLVFGRAPLFFYVSHLYLFAWIGFAFPHGAGHGILYLIWFFGLLILYPLCSLYGKFKQKKSAQSIWRFF